MVSVMHEQNIIYSQTQCMTWYMSRPLLIFVDSHLQVMW